MSANLLDGIKPRLVSGTAENDGIFHHAAGKATGPHHDDWIVWDLPDQTALATNQTYHIGLSAKGASANASSLLAYVGYKDAAGSKNYASAQSSFAIGTSWSRDEATAIVPSGMRLFAFYVTASGTYPEVWMAAPTLSLGSPIVLAIASSTLAWSAGIVATTRYYQLSSPTAATPTVPTSSSNLGSWTETEPSADTSKDLWQCECTKLDDGTETWSAATKSSAYEAAKSVSADVTKLSDKVTATVTEQMKWNDSYSSRTSSLEQTTAGFSASLDSMSSTDASIHQWMSFGQGTDGKPTLTIGTSDSDILSKQTNSGLSYQTRGGTELMALDAVSSTMGADHMSCNDIAVGKWQWLPTVGGTHFSLMWMG